MIHKYIKGKDVDRTIVLFHGTGGNEEDLIPIAEILDKDANILSLRGNVSENGMNRFFRRLSEGVFDEEDIKLRAEEIVAFLDEASKEYGLNKQNFTGVGYSNGANMIAAIQFLYGHIFTQSILFHPMVPLKEMPERSLKGTRVFIGAGENDPIVPFDNTLELNRLLENLGAEVMLKQYLKGHSLTMDEIGDASTWYKNS